MNHQKFLLLVFFVFTFRFVHAQQIQAPAPQPATVIGTVTDENNGTIPGAGVSLDGPAASDHRQLVSNADGFFQVDHLTAGVPYHVTITAKNFKPWTSQPIRLEPGQFFELTNIKLALSAVITVAAVSSTEELATEQVQAQEKQRVLGIIPNFYTTYERNPAPLTPKLKYKLALRTITDPVTFAAAGVLAGIDQATTRDPDYRLQGVPGYAERYGAVYTDAFTNILVGGAVLPSLLHQDPRYFYQGTGSVRSRLLHALSNGFLTKGDNGRWQPNYSSVGGDLISASISNLYYPPGERKASLVVDNAVINAAARAANGVVQEFVLRKLTPSLRKRTSTQQP
jgi:Carboxypeptidase regulatory-like domain